MSSSFQSAGVPVPASSSASTAPPPAATAAIPATVGPHAAALPMRDGAILVSELIALYMAHYAGRDVTRAARLSWWSAHLGAKALQDVTDDDLHCALESLKGQPGRYYAGRDVEGRPIYKARPRPISGATLNRYAAALGAVFTWAIKRRIAPKGFAHPGRGIEHEREDAGKTRFLTEEERTRLLQACRASKWPRLYVLVLLALTTGARRGELLGLRWRDVDLTHRVLHVGRSKNGDPKALPLVAAAVEELQQLRGAPEALVFPARLDPTHAMAIEDRWRQALRAARIRQFRFHDLRHSCASFLAQNGATLLEIGDLLGHRNLNMTKRYSHLAASHRSALVERVMGDVR
jgi:integrase